MTAGEATLDQLRRDPLPLSGRTALVTGVSRRAGIGYAVAHRLAPSAASLRATAYPMPARRLTPVTKAARPRSGSG